MVNMLEHHGVKGMHWGIRRKRATSKAVPRSKEPEDLKSKSDEELKARIDRLELEMRYRRLTEVEVRKKTSRGRAFVSRVLAKSAKNIADQYVDYVKENKEKNQNG